MMRRLFLLLLVLSMLCGCGNTASEENKTVCSRSDVAYTLPMFRYTVAALKTRYLSDYYEEKGEIDRFEDIPALWDMEHEGGNTVGGTILEVALTSAKTTVYFASLAKEKGIVLSKNQLASIRNSVEQTKKLFEDEDDFSDYLATFGMSKSSLEDYYTLETYAQAAQSYLYGNGGPMRVSEEEAKQYFNNRFATTYHIFFAYESGWEEQKNQVKNALENGENILDFKNYSDDNFFDSFPNGMLLYAGSTGFSEYENIALSLEIGAYTQLTDTDGVYIIQRIQNAPDAYTSVVSESGTTVRELIFTLLTDEKIRNAVSSATDLSIDRTVVEKVTVIDSPLIR